MQKSKMTAEEARKLLSKTNTKKKIQSPTGAALHPPAVNPRTGDGVVIIRVGDVTHIIPKENKWIIDFYQKNTIQE